MRLLDRMLRVCLMSYDTATLFSKGAVPFCLNHLQSNEFWLLCIVTDTWYCPFFCLVVAQSCPTLCTPWTVAPTGSSIHGILQARILEWVAISFSRGSSPPRDQTWVSYTAGRYFMVWTSREALLLLKPF